MSKWRELAVLVLLAGMLATARADASVTCGFPGTAWERRAAADVALDIDRLQEAFDWATLHTSGSVAVFRHGCLAGDSRLDPLTAETQWDGWSMTKSVTAMVVGRAVTLGAFDIDAPIGPLFPEADAAHAAITPRHLLTMTSGLHVNWVRDLNPAMPDRVRDALALPFDHEPGTHWAYQQGSVSLLGEALTRALGEDLQTFAQRELFGPIGIPAGTWTWDRDRAGHTEAWAHLKMRVGDWGRLGHLMLQRGNWNGQQLISTEYIYQAIERVDANHAYGLLFWLNGGDSFVFPNIHGTDEGTGQINPSAPTDAYIMAGAGEQRVYVIPSLDMVIVRLGERGSKDGDLRVTLWSGRAGELDRELVRLVLAAVTDADVPHPQPYSSLTPTGLPATDEGLVGDAQDAEDVTAGAGLGPSAPAGCDPTGCTP